MSGQLDALFSFFRTLDITSRLCWLQEPDDMVTFNRCTILAAGVDLGFVEGGSLCVCVCVHSSSKILEATPTSTCSSHTSSRRHDNRLKVWLTKSSQSDRTKLKTTAAMWIAR